MSEETLAHTVPCRQKQAKEYLSGFPGVMRSYAPDAHADDKDGFVESDDTVHRLAHWREDARFIDPCFYAAAALFALTETSRIKGRHRMVVTPRIANILKQTKTNNHFYSRLFFKTVRHPLRYRSCFPAGHLGHIIIRGTQNAPGGRSLPKPRNRTAPPSRWASARCGPAANWCLRWSCPAPVLARWPASRSFPPAPPRRGRQHRQLAAAHRPGGVLGGHPQRCMPFASNLYHGIPSYNQAHITHVRGRCSSSARRLPDGGAMQASPPVFRGPKIAALLYHIPRPATIARRAVRTKFHQIPSSILQFPAKPAILYRKGGSSC